MRRVLARALPVALLAAAGATIVAGYRSDADSGLVTMLLGFVLLGLAVCIWMPTVPSIGAVREGRGAPASSLPPEQMPSPYYGNGQMFGPGALGDSGGADGGQS
ncbi:MAG: hypothetical protein JWM98_911 [Thermoleophilia bacterium]|nr:hypothetical protein [Thermoleophilia bacterium]